MKIDLHIKELDSMKKYPKEIFYKGDLDLLSKVKVSIIGTRKPSKYSREITHQLSSTLTKHGVVVVSGGAMGIDATAHKGATSSNTICVLPTGINILYPKVNKSLLEDIQKKGLVLSQFDDNFKATPWSFVVRNELVVALGDVLIVVEAELDSGSMRSIEFAMKMKKEIYVIPQRLNESSATQKLLKDSKAKAIYNIEDFCKRFGTKEPIISNSNDDFLEFCKMRPTYDEALKKFPQRVFEAELSGEIEITNGLVITK